MRKRPVLALFAGLVFLIVSVRGQMPLWVRLLAWLPAVLSALDGLRARRRLTRGGRDDGREWLTEGLAASVIFLLLAAGWLRIHAAWDVQLLEKAQSLSQRSLLISGVVEDCERAGDQTILTVRVSSLRDQGEELPVDPSLSRVRLTVYEAAWIWPGSRFEMTGKLKVPDGVRNPGGFDYQNYLLARAIRLTASAPDADAITITGEAHTPYTRLRAFRMALCMRLYAVLGETQASLAGALLLGERVDTQLRSDFQEAGISHLLALSGLHVGLISALLLFLVRPLPQRAGWTLTAFLLGLWLLLTGLSPSVLRAVMMFWVAGAARRLSRTYDLFTTLLCLASLFLIASPALLYDGGFLLSFGAVAGIALFNAPLAEKLARRFRLQAEDPSPMLSGLVLSVSAGTLTFPLCLALYGEQRLILYLSNMLFVPLAPLLVAAALLVLLAPCSGTAWLFTGLSGTVSAAVRWLGALPTLSLLSGPGAYFLTGLWILALLWLCGYLGARTRRRRVFLAGAAAAAVLGGLFFVGRERAALEIIYLDVGQGSAAIVSCQGVHLLIDGGGYEDAQYAGSAVSQKVLLPALRARGITSLDAAFISHAHEDHAQGVREVLSVMGCGQVFVNPGWNDADFLDGLKVPWQRLSRGMRVRAGEMTIEVLSPDETPVLPDEEQNENSLVLSLSCRGFRFLFPGDTGAATEAALAAGGEIQPVIAALAAHHGSKYSNSEDFFRLYRPELFIISCGANNRYGHPADEVLARAQDCGAGVFRTDEDGAVILRLDGSRLSVRSCLSGRSWNRRL